MIRPMLLAILTVGSLAAPQTQYYKQGLERYAGIIRLDNDIFPDGSYRWYYNTENGISAQEQGQQKPINNNYGNAAQGDYQYTSPEGLPVQISYIADENGFQPTGNVIPTSPPIPAAIQRSLDYIARTRAAQPYNPYYRQQ